jgi:hypothetical protein
MEPRKEAKTGNEPQTEAPESKQRRFRLIKLEERIAPQGHPPHTYKCYATLHPGQCK